MVLCKGQELLLPDMTTEGILTGNTLSLALTNGIIAIAKTITTALNLIILHNI